MSEIATKISFKEIKNSADIKVCMEAECSICGEEHVFTGDTIEEIHESILFEGWLNLNSDYYGQIGWWCGCEYEVTVTVKKGD